MNQLQEEIKKALDESTQGRWNKEGVEVWRRGTGYNTSEDAHIWICDAFNDEDAHLIANAPEWLRWQNERIEQLEKALEFYADCPLCNEGMIEYPTGVEHSGVQEIGFDPCDCLIARQALGKED